MSSVVPRRIILTTCTLEKSLAPGLLPAEQRYRGPRIQAARARAFESNLPLFFLSGCFGLLEAHTPIPYYDQALTPDEVDAWTPRIEHQLRTLGITGIEALLLPADTPGWPPYHALLQASCRAAGVTLEIRLYDDTTPASRET